jgi:hypothetical protein
MGLYDEAFRWISEQDWIDVFSLSLGNVGGVSAYPDRPGFVREVVEAGKPVFAAGGNGPLAGFGETNILDDPAGPSWVVTVGASNATGYPWAQNSLPVDLLAYGAGVQVARHDSLEEYYVSSGTSLAAPKAAGFAGNVLNAARDQLVVWDRANGALVHGLDRRLFPLEGPLSDGSLMRDELEDVLFASATVIPLTCEGTWQVWLGSTGMPCVVLPSDGHSYAYEGYGSLDERAGILAKKVLLGEVAPPAKPEADEWFRYVDSLRDAYWNPRVCAWDAVVSGGGEFRCLESGLPEIGAYPGAATFKLTTGST